MKIKWSHAKTAYVVLFILFACAFVYQINQTRAFYTEMLFRPEMNKKGRFFKSYVKKGTNGLMIFAGIFVLTEIALLYGVLKRDD